MGANEIALGVTLAAAGGLTGGFALAAVGGVFGAVAADGVMPAIGMDLEAP